MNLRNIKIAVVLCSSACGAAFAQTQPYAPSRAETEISSAKESVELRLKLAEQKEIFADKKAALESEKNALTALVAAVKEETLKTLAKSADNAKKAECLAEDVASKKAALKKLSDFLDERKDSLKNEISSRTQFKNACADIAKNLDEDFSAAKNDCPAKLRALFKALDEMLARDFKFSQDENFAYLGMGVKIPKESGKIPDSAKFEKEGK